MSFTGTTDKCNVCDKTVYVMDMLSIEGMPYHKSCFKCTHCKGTLVVYIYDSLTRFFGSILIFFARFCVLDLLYIYDYAMVY